MRKHLSSVIVIFFITVFSTGISINSNGSQYLDHIDKARIAVTIEHYIKITDTSNINTDSIINLDLPRLKKCIDKMMITEIKKFIRTYTPHSKLSADTLWKISKEYNININFMLAQGYLESHFGTKGKARHTRSVFNVGSYDNGVVHYRYSNVNKSVRPYAKLLRDDYMTDGRSETFLLMTKFCNRYGKNYASDSSYENKLRYTYNYILEKSNIEEYNYIYKYIQLKYNEDTTR